MVNTIPAFVPPMLAKLVKTLPEALLLNEGSLIFGQTVMAVQWGRERIRFGLALHGPF
jgi:hypothetical protein